LAVKGEINLNVVSYLEEGIDTAQVLKICKMLGKNPTDIIRTKESIFKSLELDISENKTNEQWAEIIEKNPILLERPIILVDDKKALIARPDIAELQKTIEKKL
jgi:arsenate reductase